MKSERILAWSEFARTWGYDPVLWSVFPALELRLTRNSRLAIKPAVAGFIKNAARSVMPSLGPWLRMTGRTLFLSTGVQAQRVLAPVISVVAGKQISETVNLPALSLRQFSRISQNTLKMFAAARSALHSEMHDFHEGALEDAIQAAIMLERARRLFDGAAFDSLVVATQHNSVTRAFLCAAHAAGMSTFYLPHAPMARNSAYADLPVSYSLLRGEAERAKYVSLGARAEQLLVVGDPSLDRPLSEPLSRDGPVVWAPSPWGGDVLRTAVEVIAGAFKVVEVTPHPRMNLEELKKLCPAQWLVHKPGPTFQTLKGGCAVLLHMNSGVGLDALQMGLPTISLNVDGIGPQYYYQDSIGMPLVRDSDELAAAYAAIDFSDAAAVKRQAIAQQWCAATGPVAAKNAAAIILDLARSSPPPPRLALDAVAHLAVGREEGVGR